MLTADVKLPTGFTDLADLHSFFSFKFIDILTICINKKQRKTR